MVDPDVILGKGVKIFSPDLVNLFGCSIGDETFIGPFVEITRGVVVGKRCLIESHSFLCDGVEIHDEVFVGHGVMFVNDLYPRTNRQVVRLKTIVSHRVSLGTNATIIGGITIGKCAVIGAGSVVTRDVPDYTIVAGNPARIKKTFVSEQEMLNFIVKRQPTNQSIHEQR